MMKREGLVGLAVVLAALLMIFAGVPFGVASPKNVETPVLSPLFWPNALSWALLLAGAALTLRAALSPPDAPPDASPPRPAGAGRAGLLRVAAFGALLAGYAAAIPWAGMTWASAAVVLLMAAGARSRYWKAGVAVAALLPPALYGFFTRVAGVPIPQADFSRLPLP